MEWERISKRPDDFARANLKNYEGCVGSFSWAQAQELLDGLPDGGLNIAYEAVDRHVLAGRGGKLALRWIGRDNAVRDLSYAQLRAGEQPLRQRAGAAWNRQGRQGVLPSGPMPGTLRGVTRHAEERQRVLAIVFRVRARADQSANVHRRRQGAGYIRGILPTQDRALAQRACQP